MCVLSWRDLVLELGDLLLQRLVLLGELLVLALLGAQLALGRLELLVGLREGSLEFLAFATGEGERGEEDERRRACACGT
jgi:hypothetical protein